jgi:hypothetical protein
MSQQKDNPMSDPTSHTRPRIIQHLTILRHNVPHRPGRQRALRFIDLATEIHASCEPAAPFEIMDLLGEASQSAAAIINTGLLCSDDKAALARSVMQILEKNIARLGTCELTAFIARISPALRADRCGFVSLIEPIVSHLGRSQLRYLDRALRKTPVRASDPYHNLARASRLELRRKIAWLSGDTALYFDINAQCAVDDPIMTGRVLLAADSPEDAMRTLADGRIGRRASPLSDRLQADILAAQGATGMAQDLRLSCFHRDLCADALRDYLRQVPDFDDILAENDALSYAATFPEPRLSVRFFLRYNRPDLAAARVMADVDTWSEVDTWDQDDAAADLAPQQPLAASILLRGLVTRIMLEKDLTSFRQARRYLKQLGAMAILADADNRRPAQYKPHALWIEDLHERMIRCGFLRPAVRSKAAA